MVNCLSSNLPNSLLVESRHGIVSPEYLATIRLHVRDKQNENLYCKSFSRCLLFSRAVRPLPLPPSFAASLIAQRFIPLECSPKMPHACPIAIAPSSSFSSLGASCATFRLAFSLGGQIRGHRRAEFRPFQRILRSGERISGA